ncbi:sulfurtransferase [Haloglomus litoreum]|uniref:sulfurtransferase n=1 Tax=Haloglomus litoreum TaxID=3034026 RepID=UPI0023E88F7B|nr:sulfurtransferase [Haloglomus sp. DT116]
MPVVVSVDWLAAHREDPDVAVVDVRDAWEFDGIGHVPGAVNVPFDAFRATEHAAQRAGDSASGDEPRAHGEAEAGMLPGSRAFADLLSEAGIDNGDRVVAYDDTNGVFAARLLVTAELYGHDPDRLHLLDGDFSAYNLAHETTSAATEVEPTDYRAAYQERGPLVPLATVEAAIDDPGTVIVDTREEWEFEEGHIPGAVRLDWQELVDAETRGLLPADEMRDLLAERGIRPGERVLLYCNTARRISHTYTVLRHLGFPNLAFYEGSLTEWEAAGNTLETA